MFLQLFPLRLSRRTQAHSPQAMPTVLFTSDTAREMQRRSTASYHRNRERRTREPLPVNPSQTSDAYLARSARIVREHIDHIDLLTRKCDDASELDRLASARQKYVDQEFALSGRPKPGQYRPEKQVARRRIATTTTTGSGQTLITGHGIDAPPSK